MYKRPLPRVRNSHETRDHVDIPEGSFLYSLLNPKPTIFFKFEKDPIYQKESYLTAIKKHYKECGIPFKDPQLPDYVRRIRPEPTKEPELGFGDQVYMKMRILKSGIVRIKLDASIATLYEKYYRKALRPPMTSIIQAYKSMGFSEMFLEKIKKKFALKVKEQKRVGGVIDKIFNKEPVKKVKKKKEEVKVDVEKIEEEKIEEEKIEEDDEEDDIPGEDDGLDVEPDPEEEVEEEPGEEEYNSD